MNMQKDWKAKLEFAYSFMLEYSKITVCTPMHIRMIEQPLKLAHRQDF